MAQKIVEIVDAIPVGQKSVGHGCDASVIKEIEENYDIKLPEDYKTLLLTYNSVFIKGDNRVIQIMEAEIALGYNEDELFEAIPGMFAIGTDGGGALYFYDTKNIFNYGAYSVFLVHMGSLDQSYSRLLATTLTEVIKQILEGQKFFDRPTIGESQTERPG